ncbi:MAG TPA: hypothetical protein VFT45_01235 [Longimicrobium sp.]|nr:hypothetical protein [Longimicrobium sp.]
MANHSADAAADLNAALDAFAADLAALPTVPIPAPLEQQAFAAFYHS